MSSPHDLLRDGHLSEALDAQVQVVKSRPTDPDDRFLLFVMLCFDGSFERADVHLHALIALEGAKRGDASIYQALLSAEYERQTIFHKEGRPTVSQDAPGVEARISAVESLRRNDARGAAAAIARANEEVADRGGKLDGRPFESICDYDDLLGNVLEVFAGGRYMWIPFDEIRSLEISEPTRQLDLLWIPAQLVRTDGETSYVHLPVLYPGSATAESTDLRLGRSTEWVELAEDLYRGLGQKLFFATLGDDVIEAPLLETRVIEFAASEATGGG